MLYKLGTYYNSFNFHSSKISYLPPTKIQFYLIFLQRQENIDHPEMKKKKKIIGTIIRDPEYISLQFLTRALVFSKLISEKQKQNNFIFPDR